MVCALQREDAGAIRAFHDERLYLASADRFEGLLGLFQPQPKFLHLRSQSLSLGAEVLGRVAGHQVFSRRSSPKRILSTFDRSPMKRRNGAGSTRIRVGVAMICSSLARVDFW